MTRFLSLSAAALSLALAAATGASAAPKNDGSGPVCEAGVGKAVCCKTMVANHCAYVSCCEVGNSAFFNAKHCSLCDAHAKERTHVAAATAATGNAYVDSCEVGNRGFFNEPVAYGTRGGKSACCAAKK